GSCLHTLAAVTIQRDFGGELLGGLGISELILELLHRGGAVFGALFCDFFGHERSFDVVLPAAPSMWLPTSSSVRPPTSSKRATMRPSLTTSSRSESASASLRSAETSSTPAPPSRAARSCE